VFFTMLAAASDGRMVTIRGVLRNASGDIVGAQSDFRRHFRQDGRHRRHRGRRPQGRPRAE
jgi:hypothetical protein